VVADAAAPFSLGVGKEFLILLFFFGFAPPNLTDW